MGLDQYAISSTCDMLDLHHSEEQQDPNDDSSIFYRWRKHNRMQGFMENLWLNKYKPESEKIFNTEYVELNLQDICDLEHAVSNAKLPYTEGFFFGPDSYGCMDAEEIRRDMDFISQARELLSKGKRVWYTSWW